MGLFGSSKKSSNPSSQTSPSSQPSQTREERQEVARRRFLERRAANQALLESLPLGGLYVVLFYRTEPPLVNDFHWSLYFHNTSKRGTKYHVTNGTGYWMADHAGTGGVFNSNFLVAVIRISIVPEDRFAAVDHEARALDSELNVPGMTCRVWVLHILNRLKAAGLIYFSDLDELQTELLAFGNQHRFSAVANEQPRPLVAATKCR